MSQGQIEIKPRTKLEGFNIAELLEFKDLLYILSWRDIKVRYKQTAMGVSWAIIQPLVTTFIFTFFFNRLAGIDSGELPYQVFVYLGLIYWYFFSTTLSNANEGFIANKHIMTKVYFPRIIIPLSALVTTSIDTFIMGAFFLIMLVFYGVSPHPGLIFILPYALTTLTLTTFGLSLFFASINVKYRDFRYALPFMIQTLLFLTPVIYPTTILDSSLRWIIALNPLTSVIETTRTYLTTSPSPDYSSMTISFLSALIILLIGFNQFRNTEAYFADIA